MDPHYTTTLRVQIFDSKVFQVKLEEIAWKTSSKYKVSVEVGTSAISRENPVMDVALDRVSEDLGDYIKSLQELQKKLPEIVNNNRGIRVRLHPDGEN